jgi:acyl-CoA synthetase (AMP-forming)/AMP-acid ligase II
LATIPSLLAQSARAWADQRAMQAPNRRALTFAELAAEVSASCGRLSQASLEGARIAVALNSAPEFLTTCLAAMTHGACLPLNAAMRKAEFETRFATLRPDLVVCDNDGAVPAAVAQASGIPVLHLAGARLELGLPAGDPRNVALVIQTSGTTGPSKNVPLTHANLCASATHIVDSMGLTAADRFRSPAPLHHIAGITLALASLSAGSCTLLAPGLPAAALLDLFDEYRPTWFWATPALLAELVIAGRRAGFRPGRAPLRCIRCGAAALSPELLREAEELFGAPVIETYGMTEAAPQITCNPFRLRGARPDRLDCLRVPSFASDLRRAKRH